MNRLLRLILAALIGLDGMAAWGATCEPALAGGYSIGNIYQQPHVVDMIPSDFFEPSSGKITASLYADASFFTRFFGQEAIEHFTGKNAADEKHIFWRNVETIDGFFENLLGIYQKSGPIDRLLVFVHGSPGAMHFDDGAIDFGWYKRNYAKLDDLPQDLFAPNAKIILLSCELAAGSPLSPESGTGFVFHFFRHLIKNGGTVLASRRTVTFKDENFEPDLAKRFKEASKKKMEAHRLGRRREEAFAMNVFLLGPVIFQILISHATKIIKTDYKSLFGPALQETTLPPIAKGSNPWD